MIVTTPAARAAIMYPAETVTALVRRDAAPALCERFIQALIAWNRENSLAAHYVGQASALPATHEEAALDALCGRAPRRIGDLDPQLRAAFEDERRAVQEAVEDRFALLVLVADEIVEFLGAADERESSIPIAGSLASPRLDATQQAAA